MKHNNSTRFHVLCSVAFAFALSFAFADRSIAAEKSGVFMGLGLGNFSASGNSKRQQFAAYNDPSGNYAGHRITSQEDTKLTQLYETDNYELFAGGKYFFDKKIGMRMYGALRFVPDSATSQHFVSFPKNLQNVRLGSDFLFNFLGNDDVSLGLLAGLSVGRNYFKGNVFQPNTQENVNTTYYYALPGVQNSQDSSYNPDALRVQYSKFSADFNIGFRAVAKEKHSVEGLMTFGLLGNSLDVENTTRVATYDPTLTYINGNAITDKTITKITFDPKFTLRYVYNF